MIGWRLQRAQRRDRQAVKIVFYFSLRVKGSMRKLCGETGDSRAYLGMFRSSHEHIRNRFTPLAIESRKTAVDSVFQKEKKGVEQMRFCLWRLTA